MNANILSPESIDRVTDQQIDKLIRIALNLADRFAEYVEGDSFDLQISIDEITITVTLAPDTIVKIEVNGEVVLFAVEPFSATQFEIHHFVNGPWVNRLYSYK